MALQLRGVPQQLEDRGIPGYDTQCRGIREIQYLLRVRGLWTYAARRKLVSGSALH